MCAGLLIVSIIPADVLTAVLYNDKRLRTNTLQQAKVTTRTTTTYNNKDVPEYLYPILNKQTKPTISQASLEVLSIIAYNPRATRADIDSIRGVDSSASIYRLLEYNLIEQAGKADLPGRPMTYKVTNEFLKLFGYSSLDDLPDLPSVKDEQLEIEEKVQGRKD